MKRQFLFIALMALSVSALADRFDTVRYECKQMSKDKDGVLCSVLSEKGEEALLLVRVHSSQKSPEDVRERTKYLIGRTTHNYYASGGNVVVMRTINPDGTYVERTCTRVKGKPNGNCQDWEPVPKQDSLAANFKPIE